MIFLLTAPPGVGKSQFAVNEIVKQDELNEKNLKIPNLNLEKLSQQVEVLEQNFSKREIAFMFASLFRQTALKSRVSSLLDDLREEEY